MMRKTAAILVASGIALLAACGQKGPLYVPGVPRDAPWPYPASAEPARKAPPAERKLPDLPGTSDDRK